jgi:DNA-binding transcriptional ArsR family regulator
MGRAREPRLTLRNLSVTYHAVKIDATLTALADPTRRELLRRLAHHPCRASALAKGFPISRPAICKHTRLLKKAGLITATKHGREQIYELAPTGDQAITELIEHLQEVGRFWERALDAFKRHLEEKGEKE